MSIGPDFEVARNERCSDWLLLTFISAAKSEMCNFYKICSPSQLKMQRKLQVNQKTCGTVVLSKQTR